MRFNSYLKEVDVSKDYTIEKHAKNIFRIKLKTNKVRFGQIHKKSKWEAEIRDKDGNLVRYAGIWNSKKEAVDEILFILMRG